jgi:hypothetical protein
MIHDFMEHKAREIQGKKPQLTRAYVLRSEGDGADVIPMNDYRDHVPVTPYDEWGVLGRDPETDPIRQLAAGKGDIHVDGHASPVSRLPVRTLKALDNPGDVRVMKPGEIGELCAQSGFPLVDATEDYLTAMMDDETGGIY